MKSARQHMLILKGFMANYSRFITSRYGVREYDTQTRLLESATISTRVFKLFIY